MFKDEFPGVHGAAYKELARRFGGYFRVLFNIHTQVAFGTAQEIAQGNADRVFIMFLNVSGGNVTIGPSPAVALSGGIVVAPQADRSFNLIDHAVMPCEAWFMNAAALNGVGVLEVVRDSARLPER